MQKLAIMYRAAQLHAHNCHNLVSGPTFLADHEHLGELYPIYEGTYDSIIEKMIGLDIPCDLQEITQTAGMQASMLAGGDLTSPKSCFSSILKLELKFQEEIDSELTGKLSNGVQNFLQGLADLSQDRCYKLKQLLK